MRRLGIFGALGVIFLGEPRYIMETDRGQIRETGARGLVEDGFYTLKTDGIQCIQVFISRNFVRWKTF
jgi:hypothetical protein